MHNYGFVVVVVEEQRRKDIFLLLWNWRKEGGVLCSSWLRRSQNFGRA